MVSTDTTAPDPASAATTGSTRTPPRPRRREPPGTGGLTTDVEQVGTVGEQPQALLHRCRGLDEVPAVAEGVRS
jgi:hypothetical protein